MKLSDESIRTATHFLADRDPALAHVFEKYGYPPLWFREPGFSTLVHIILEQQVSLASADAAFSKLKAKIGEVSPEKFLELDDEMLREIGFSRQKTKYARLLAERILTEKFEIDILEKLDDEAVKMEMIKSKGIGDWTAQVYLLMCLLRPDVLPKGDIALLEAMKVLKNLEKRPNHDNFVSMTENWRPWRSVGARLLWHFYLSERRKKAF